MPKKETPKKDIPPFDVFFYIDTIKEKPKVLFYMYALNSETHKYTAALFDNNTDHIKELSLDELKADLVLLHKHKTYHYLKYSPTQLHELLRPHVSSFYSAKWFESKYIFILQQATLAGYQSLLTVKH